MMKLTMKNQYTFQAAEGYLDDPDLMSTDEVKGQLRYWHGLLEDMDADAKLPCDLVYLSSFIKSLADGEVEYENPLLPYHYHVGFEYWNNFEVMAESPEQADQIARDMLDRMADAMPAKLNESEGRFEYLEQDDYGRGMRLVEREA